MRRRAKIIATLGPATSGAADIESLFRAGVDVFRLNFSHGGHAEHRKRIEFVREIERRYNRPITVMADLQGPKLRIGAMDHASLIEGQEFRLELGDQCGDSTRACLPHPEIFEALRPGVNVLLDDGRIRLRVSDTGPDYANTVVSVGGRLTDRKGVNLPNVLLPLAAVTDKDREDLDMALAMGVDWVALSFVQRPEDVAEARQLIGDRASILSKLEKPAAIEQLDEIIRLSDAVMVARGDLGVELPPEDVPAIQKEIVRRCRVAGKPVVIATQMLESMIRSPTATRAEASDVANAIYDGADAVMLSAETATGDYPVEAVAMMDRIIARVECDDSYRTLMDAVRPPPEQTASDAITAAARQVAETINAVAIVTYTSSGSTTLRAARERPTVPILCLTENVSIARRLAIAWGVRTVETSGVQRGADMVETAAEIALREELADRGDRLVVTAGVPFGRPGTTNLLRIVRVSDPA